MSPEDIRNAALLEVIDMLEESIDLAFSDREIRYYERIQENIEEMMTD